MPETPQNPKSVSCIEVLHRSLPSVLMRRGTLGRPCTTEAAAGAGVCELAHRKLDTYSRRKCNKHVVGNPLTMGSVEYKE